jgi:hypothetical protein
VFEIRTTHNPDLTASDALSGAVTRLCLPIFPIELYEHGVVNILPKGIFHGL